MDSRLDNDGKIAHLAGGCDRLLDLGQVAEGLQDEQINTCRD